MGAYFNVGKERKLTLKELESELVCVLWGTCMLCYIGTGGIEKNKKGKTIRNGRNM